MADNVIKVSVTSTKSQRVSVSSSQQATNITASPDTGRFWSQTSKNWAVSENIVDGEDYSSKYYANKSKGYAQSAESYLESTRETYNSFVSDANDYRSELTELKDAGAVEINEAVASGKDEINSTKTTILNDIEFVADGEKKEIEDLADLIKENAEEIASRTSFAMFDTVLKDHVLTYEESKGLAPQGTYVYKNAVAGERYGYPDFYAKCLEEYNEATATETVNGVTVKVHPNGHKFYDIANKSAIDGFFNTMGSAWFYGVDTENERIFLPRNNYFEQATGDVSEVGQSVEAGLPNITGSITGAHSGQGIFRTTSGAFTLSSGPTQWGAGGQSAENTNNNYRQANFDASKSNSIYGNSNTVQPNAVKKLLYICVGNTVSQSTITNVVDVTTTENDTIPLGYSTYQANVQPSISWLKSAGQWNDGNKIYTTFYNKFVQKIGQAFAGGYVKEYTDSYDDYDLVINQDDMTFRLPLLDGSEDLLSDRYTDLTLNASGSTYTAPANGWFYASKIASGEQYLCLINTTATMAIEARVVRSGEGLTTYIPVKKDDVCKVTYDAGGATQDFRFIYAQGNGSLYFKVANAVQNLELLDAGEVLEAVADIASTAVLKTENKAYITQTYVNGTSWYRVYSDGWCEQGGRVSVNYSHTTTTITLLKTFKNTNYSIQLSHGGFANAGVLSPNWQSLTTSSFVLYADYTSDKVTAPTNWQACGYIV